MGVMLAIVNQKGGVGKTTTAINLSACLAELGRRVLLVDCDPQANATSGLGFHRGTARPHLYDALSGLVPIRQAIHETPFANLFLLPSDMELAGVEVELATEEGREQALRTLLSPLKNEFDLLVLDAPPSLGILTVNCLAAADYLLIPLQCEYYALEGLGNLLSTVRRIRMAFNPSLTILGILRTMFDSRTNLTHQVSAELQKHFPQWLLRTVIPRTVRLAEAPSHGLPIIHYDGRSPAADAYRQLAREVLERLGL
ncbi:MAG: ParA family protein [Armatimonadota bacterium]|jgi:chromosome partitioning protein|nr:ParA family protein [Armatimonadota bacterium]